VKLKLLYVAAAKQDQIGIADIDYDDPAKCPVALNSAISDHVSRCESAELNSEFISTRDANDHCYYNSGYFRRTIKVKFYLPSWLMYLTNE
jgi:hypothetical protein